MSHNIHKDVNGEWFYPSDSYILSETNSAGIILYANDLFCELANYSREELLGEPHNILRHKDMPRAAFQSLWDDVKAKGFWTGIVKNLRKDGGFYWVKATVLRKISANGDVKYLSIRTLPSKNEVEEASSLYKELLKAE